MHFLVINFHWSYIRIACLANNGNARVGAALIDCGADVNHKDKYGQTPLMHCAFHRNHIDLAKLLLAHGADPDIKNKVSSIAPNSQKGYLIAVAPADHIVRLFFIAQCFFSYFL